jgi:hypothetical protein
VEDEEIENIWRDYFDKLYNDGNGSSMTELDDSLDDTNRRFVPRIQETEVKEQGWSQRWASRGHGSPTVHKLQSE